MNNQPNNHNSVPFDQDFEEIMDLEYEFFNDDEYDDIGYLPETSPGQQILRVQRIPLMKEVMFAASSASPSNASYNIKDRSSTGSAVCAVCGDQPAKLHYGVLACYGCKGFFRRTLIGRYQYHCRFNKNCVVDKFQRNTCRQCRFQRCLAVGMDPKAVRPDRDQTGKQRVPRIRKKTIDESLMNHMVRIQGDDWSRKLPTEVRCLLLELMKIEAKVVKGDDTASAKVYPHHMVRDQKNVSLREMFEQKPSMDGRRTEMRYEPFRMARTEELSEIAHRRAIAAVDWVDSLTEIAGLPYTEDKVSLVKSCYSPLTIFNFSARTAQNTANPDILCLCSHSYVPRKLPAEFNETNHLSNVLIDRTLNELVAPLRKLNLREEEIVPLKAIIILNPNTKGLSLEASKAIGDLRDKIQDMLFQIVKELNPVYSASSRFGNLLLLLPTITTLSGLMSENMQFCQAFGGRSSGDPLLSEMFGDYKFTLDDCQISSSVSPPLFENPAEITLQSISPPLLDSPTMPSMRSRLVQKREASTQTEIEPQTGRIMPQAAYGTAMYNPTASIANTMIGGGRAYSPPLPISLDSPFGSLMDDDDDAFPSAHDLNDISNLVDLGGEYLFNNNFQ